MAINIFPSSDYSLAITEWTFSGGSVVYISSESIYGRDSYYFESFPTYNQPTPPEDFIGIIFSANAENNLNYFEGNVKVSYNAHSNVGIGMSSRAEVLISPNSDSVFLLYYENRPTIEFDIYSSSEINSYVLIGSSKLSILPVSPRPAGSDLGVFTSTSVLSSLVYYLNDSSQENPYINNINIIPKSALNDCSCAESFPPVLKINSNLFNNSLFDVFMNINNFKYNESFGLSYSDTTKMWMKNFKYQGNGISGGFEKWSINIFLECSDFYKGDSFSESFFNFSFLFKRYMSLTDETTSTKFTYAFNKNQLCSGNIINSKFSINTQRNGIVSSSSISGLSGMGSYYDNIGNYKNSYWRRNPLINVTIYSASLFNQVEFDNLNAII